MYRLLASLAPACNDTFTTLLLPAAITIDPAQGLLVLPHYDGDDLAARWHESDGGAMLDTGLAAAIPALLADLARIDTACVTTRPGALGHPRPGLRPHRSPVPLGRHRPETHSRRAALPAQCARAERLLAHQQHIPMIVSNRDFYPQKPHRAAGRPHCDR